MPTEREWAEAFRRLDRGESSYESEAKRLGVGKGTVYRHHMGELQRRVNEERSELSRVREELAEAEQRLAGLEGEYERKRLVLERRLQTQAKELSLKLQALEEEKRRVEGEISRAREKLSSTLQELNRITTTQERLKRIGVDKVASLTEFVEGYEALGFSSQQVQNLVVWRQSVAEMGIDPDKLGEFIKKKGLLEKHILNLRREKNARERKINQLKEEHMRLWNQTTSLRDEISRLTHLGYTLKEGRLTLPCKVCRMYGISLDLTSIENAIMKGSWCSASCIFCGQWSSYAALESAWYVAQLVLPAIRIRPTRNVAKKR